MKKKTVKLVLGAMFAAATILAACSSDGGSPVVADTPPVSSAESSALSDVETFADGGEPFDADSPSQDKDDETEEPKTVRIDADGGLRMRGGPGTDYDIIKVIPQNAHAEITKAEEEHPDWLYVAYDGDFGWVSKEYVSYELDAELAAEYDATDWAKVYYDYLSTFEPMTYTSTMYGGTYTVAGRVTNVGKAPCSAVGFYNFDGYDYPVLMCWDGGLLDAEGNMDGPSFELNIYLIENGSLSIMDYLDPKWKTFMNPEGPNEPKGNPAAYFHFKPENGGGPENIEKALEWLKTQM